MQKLQKIYWLLLIFAFSLACLRCTEDKEFRKADRDDLYLPTGFAIEKDELYVDYQPRRKDSALTFTYFEMTIFSKDVQIFQCDTTNDALCGWDGKSNGEYVEAGQYFCEVRYRLENIDQTFEAETHLEVIIH